MVCLYLSDLQRNCLRFHQNVASDIKIENIYIELKKYFEICVENRQIPNKKIFDSVNLGKYKT